MDEQKPGAGAPTPPAGASDTKPAPARRPEAEAAPKLDAPVPSRCLDRLREGLADAVEEVSYHCGVPIVRVAAARIVDVCRFLKDDPGCRMLLLADLCGVDMIRLRPEPRFDVVYHLTEPRHAGADHSQGRRLRTGARSRR